MFTIVMMIVAAYLAIVLDTYLLDAYYYYAADESVTYYLTEPWQTVKRAGVVIQRAVVSLYWRVRVAVESMWDAFVDWAATKID